MFIRTTTLAVAMLAAVTGAHGQQRAMQVPATLTLDDAIRIARQNNPAYLQQMNNAQTASSTVRQRWAAFIPTLDASMGFNGSSSTTSRGTGFFGETVEAESFTVKSSSANQSVGLNLQLFDGGAMFSNLAAARARERSTDASIDLQRATLDGQVTMDFHAARQAALLVDVEVANLQAARDRHQRNQELFRLAAISQVDLIESERNVISAQGQLRRAEADARKALLTLGTTLGLDATISFEIAPELPEVFDPSTLDAESMVNRALTASPRMVQSAAALEAARKDAAAARGSRWPTVSTRLGYGRSTSEDGFGAIGNFNPHNSRGWSFGFTFSLPLFDRFGTSANVTAADVAREDAEQDVRAARIEIEQTVRSGLIDLDRTFQEYQDAENIADLSRQQVELAEEQFRVGALDFLRFQQLVDANAQAQRQAVQARFAFVNARVALEQILGAPVAR